MTKKQHWSAEIHKESKTEHKNKISNKLPEALQRAQKAWFVAEQKIFQETHLILPLSFALNIHMEYAVVEMH